MKAKQEIAILIYVPEKMSILQKWLFVDGALSINQFNEARCTIKARRGVKLTPPVL